MTNDSKRYTNKDFWDNRAASFPRFEAGDDTYEARMLRLARENGVDFAAKQCWM